MNSQKYAVKAAKQMGWACYFSSGVAGPVDGWGLLVPAWRRKGAGAICPGCPRLLIVDYFIEVKSARPLGAACSLASAKKKASIYGCSSLVEMF